MTDADAFIRTICAAPDDDTPRLVFADWLEENGQADRAEFIRLQIELAKMPESDRPLLKVQSFEQRHLRDDSTTIDGERPVVAMIVTARGTWHAPEDAHNIPFDADIQGRLFGVRWVDELTVDVPFGGPRRATARWWTTTDPCPHRAARYPVVDRINSLLGSRQWGTSLGHPSTNTRAAARYVWAGPAARLDDSDTPGQAGWEFRRGFVELVRCTLLAWREHADAIRAATPLRKVVLRECPRLRAVPDYRHRKFWVSFDDGLSPRPVNELDLVAARGTQLVRLVDDLMRELFAARWPGIEFEVPPLERFANVEHVSALCRLSADVFGTRP